MKLSGGFIDQLNIYVSLCERFGELAKDGAKWNLGMQTFTSKKAAIEAMQEPQEWARLTALLRAKMIA
jgi:hypothetical protein